MDEKEFWQARADFVRRARQEGFGDMLDKVAVEEAMLAAAKWVEDKDAR
jgi:hypothetical protein